MLFGGNLARQPVFVQMQREHQASGTLAPFRTVGDLNGADTIMNRGLFVGVYPGLSAEQIETIASRIDDFCRREIARAA